LPLALVERDDALALEIVSQQPQSAAPAVEIDDLIIETLSVAATPQTAAALRTKCQIRTATCSAHLAAMVRAGRIVKSGSLYHLKR